jgi:hypothetical protein
VWFSEVSRLMAAVKHGREPCASSAVVEDREVEGQGGLMADWGRPAEHEVTASLVSVSSSKFSHQGSRATSLYDSVWVPDPIQPIKTLP